MNDTLVEFGARGFGATAFSASRAAISMLAAENWTDTAQGTMLNFYTTGTGQSAPTQRMSISANGTVIVSGPVQATAFNTVSDMRFKEDIQPIDNALDMVLRLNGVYFKWNGLHHSRLKQSNAKERQVGLIAQQVQEVIPEAVSEWDAQGAKDYLAVDYNRLVAITIEAIKELKAENNKLLDKVTALERTMKELAGS
jgi:flagellar biosynthesis regulator FlaF